MSESKLTQVQGKNETAKAQQVEKQQVEQVETAVSTLPTLQRAFADPSDITPNDAKILQRTFGNQAVRRFVLQRKMTVGPVGDKYEQEADSVAKQVMQTINTPTAPPVQRQEEEDELQMKPFLSAITLPTISTLQRQVKPFESNLPPFPFLQRQEEEELQAKGNSMLTGGDLSGDLESSVQQAKSGGQPLGDNVRGSMEQAFNADFSSVKVHTDSQSDTLNRSISARAFTTGPDIFFRDGEYNPASSTGKTLIAHELTHTIQQGASPALRRQFDINSTQRKQASETAIVQRQEEEELQMKPLLQRQEEEEDVQMMPISTVQRQEEEELQMKPLLQQTGSEVQRKDDVVEDTVLAGYQQDKPQIKADLAASIDKFKAAINTTFKDENALVQAGLRDDGRDSFYYRSLFKKYKGGLLGDLERFDAKWHVAETGGLLADVGLALKRLPLPMFQRGLSFDQIMPTYQQKGSDHVRGRKDRSGKLKESGSAWADDLKMSNLEGNAGPSSTTTQLLHVVSSIGGFSNEQVEAMMIALVKFWKGGIKRTFGGGHHTAVEVWAPYMGYLEAQENAPELQPIEPQDLVEDEPLDQQEVVEEVQEELPNIEQFQNVPKGPLLGKSVTFNNGKQVLGAKKENGARDILVTFVTEPGDLETEIPLTMFKVICNDSMRRNGVALIQPAGFAGRSYYVALGDLYELDTGTLRVS